MADFNAHITQAKKNLAFLESINHNNTVPDCIDWQVTTAFYTAVHLVNAHLAKTANIHYASHKKVAEAINPYKISPCALPEDEYNSYISLQNLSKRSRYLCKDTKHLAEEAQQYLTYDKHFSRAIRHLDKLLQYIAKKHFVSFPITKIISVELYNSHNGIINFKCLDKKVVATSII